MQKRHCKSCSKELIQRHQLLYCSNKCQSDYRYRTFIQKWLALDKEGKQITATKNVCRHLKRYLLEVHNTRCAECNWGKINPITLRVPLEVDHVDGNAENNSLKNLRLLCPNCHALTPHFRNLNRGNGRKWRGSRHTIT